MVMFILMPVLAICSQSLEVLLLSTELWYTSAPFIRSVLSGEVHFLQLNEHFGEQCNSFI